MFAAAVVALYGCGGSEPELVLEGEDHVHVERLGDVPAPSARLSDGSAPKGLVWSVSSEAVAQVEGDRIVAKGPGSATVTGEWHGQTVSWELEVEPALELHFDKPPAEITVGESAKLMVVARGGDAPTQLSYASSAPDILEVSGDGNLTAKAEGTAYITVEGHGGEAMAEINVVP